MIKTSINQQIGDALKAHDELRLTTLRMLSSALNYEFIAKQHELSEEEELTVVKREVKKRNDTIEVYRQLLDKDPARVQEKIDRELAEVKILKEFLPPDIDVSDLKKIVDETIEKSGASSIKDMGKVMAMVKERVGVSADGKTIADMVKEKLQ